VKGVSRLPAIEPPAADPGPAVPIARVETFEAFYRRELPGLVGLARALTGSWAVADDLAQESMLVAYRRWDEVSRLDLPVTWVRKVCAYQATSQFRRRAAEARALIRLGSRRDLPAPGPLQHETFWAEVRRLPRRQAQSIALHYVYDMSVVEIATTLGCSDSSVKAHLVRGRAALARRLGADLEERL
jgi:RNA polymerase sigma-70 factor, ECF subfamily